MDWAYLDSLDKNLLYTYSKGLAKGTSETHFQKLYSYEEEDEMNEFFNAEIKRKTAFYIIWFVFRYVLECDTLEKAMEKTAEEGLKILQEYKLLSLFNKRHLYIGVYGIGEIYLYKPEDLKIVLEILYNRYDFWESLECFIKRTEGQRRNTRNRAIESVKNYKKMLERKE